MIHDILAFLQAAISTVALVAILVFEWRVIHRQWRRNRQGSDDHDQ